MLNLSRKIVYAEVLQQQVREIIFGYIKTVEVDEKQLLTKQITIIKCL